MALVYMTASDEWDFPFFKRLAHNDTGAATGNQAGIVIPKPLRSFFPQLSLSTTSSAMPTTGLRLHADLFLENRFLGSVNTRYQYQTWGGTRAPESRLTDQLPPLRNLAVRGDILIIQRSIEHLDRYRLTLIQRTSAAFSLVDSAVNGRRWGQLTTSFPMTQRDLATAIDQERSRELSTFALFDTSAVVVESLSKKVSRSIAFRESVCRLYAHTCALCQTALRTPSGSIDLDAAHIVPRSKFGADDARNGIALCKRHHWAFDRGLFGLSNEFKVLVPNQTLAISQNAGLSALRGAIISAPIDPNLAPHKDALDWHRNNVMLRE